MRYALIRPIVSTRAKCAFKGGPEQPLTFRPESEKIDFVVVWMIKFLSNFEKIYAGC